VTSSALKYVVVDTDVFSQLFRREDAGAGLDDFVKVARRRRKAK
jgi:hypothetical protein